MKSRKHLNKCLAFALGVAAMMFAACGDDSTISKNSDESGLAADVLAALGDITTVADSAELGNCTAM